MGFFNLSTSNIAPAKKDKKNRSFFTSFMDSSPQLHHQSKKRSTPKELAQKCCTEEYGLGKFLNQQQPTNRNDSDSISTTSSNVAPVKLSDFEKAQANNTPIDTEVEKTYSNSSLQSYPNKKKKQTPTMAILKCCPFDDVSALIDVDKFEKKQPPTTTLTHSTSQTNTSNLAASSSVGTPAVKEQPVEPSKDIIPQDRAVFSSSFLLSNNDSSNMDTSD